MFFGGYLEGLFPCFPKGHGTFVATKNVLKNGFCHVENPMINHLQNQSLQGGALPGISWFITLVSIDISTINHSY